MVRRILVIWLMRFPSDLWLRRRPVAGPFALCLRHGGADRLHCLNPEALGAGLERGMALAEARAILPELITAPADPLREAEGLEGLRRFAQRYSPQVAPEGEDGLVADVTGVAHLFGGEAELREDLQARFERAGFALQTAIAPTRGGAWALSRHGGGIVPEGGLPAALGPLPLAALRLPEDLREGLARMGLQRISELMALPRAPLSRRFGPLVLQRLDQMLGQLPEPVAAPVGLRHFAVRLGLPEPIGRSADVMAGLARLLTRLCAKLAEAEMGARRLRLELQRVDHERVVLEIGLARPMRDPDRIAALFLKHVEEADAGFGIDGLRLEAHVVEPLAPVQLGGPVQALSPAAAGRGRGAGHDAGRAGEVRGGAGTLPHDPARGGAGDPSNGWAGSWGAGQDAGRATGPSAQAGAALGAARSGAEEGLADLISGLGNRLGFDRVLRFVPAPSRLPERSFIPLPALERGAAPSGKGPARPLVLFPPEPLSSVSGHPPVRFIWRRRAFTTLRLQGPERITPDWWDIPPGWATGLRDYWRVETREGPRLWLFHTPRAPGWAVEGEFP